jgi:hypothetical protein
MGPALSIASVRAILASPSIAADRANAMLPDIDRRSCERHHSPAPRPRPRSFAEDSDANARAKSGERRHAFVRQADDERLKPVAWRILLLRTRTR